MKSKIAPLLARCVFVQSLIKDPLPWCHLLNVSQFSNFLMESNLISESGPLVRSLQSLLSCPLNTLQVAFQKPKYIIDFLLFFGNYPILLQALHCGCLAKSCWIGGLQPLYMGWATHSHIWLRRLLLPPLSTLILRYQKVFVRLDLIWVCRLAGSKGPPPAAIREGGASHAARLITGRKTTMWDLRRFVKSISF